MAQHTQIRGAALWARREWLRENRGDEGMARMLEVLSPAGRHLLRSDIDKTGWYHYPLFIELAVKMDQEFGDGRGRLNIELGRWSAHLSTRSVFKLFIRLGSVSWALERASRLWSEMFNAGSFAIEPHPDERWCVGEVVDFPHPHICFSYAVLGFALGVIEMSGETFVRGELLECRSHGAERTRLRVQWGPPPIDDSMRGEAVVVPDAEADPAR